MTTVDAACAKGWRHIYFNANTFRYWGVYMLAIVGIAVLGWSWLGLALALVLYVPRVFFISGVYHRYFSHRSYKTSRWFQLVLAICAQATLGGACCGGRRSTASTTSSPTSPAIRTRRVPGSGGRNTAGTCLATPWAPTTRASRTSRASLSCAG